MQFEMSWKFGFDFQNPFGVFKRLDEVHDYVWEGDDEEE
jgi:hypothetical protein